MKARRAAAWVAGGAVFLVALHLAFGLLEWVLADPHPDRGGVVITFENRADQEVYLISLRLDGEKLSPSPDGNGWVVRNAASPNGARVVALTAKAGRRQALLSYRVSAAGVAADFAFDVELVALHDCQLRIAFESDGPRAGACERYGRASYGGAWPN